MQFLRKDYRFSLNILFYCAATRLGFLQSAFGAHSSLQFPRLLNVTSLQSGLSVSLLSISKGQLSVALIPTTS